MNKIKTSGMIIAALLLLSSCETMTTAALQSPGIVNNTAVPIKPENSIALPSSVSPSASPNALPSASIGATETAFNQLVINEDNFTQYFQFGMNHKKVESVLNDIGIDIFGEGSGGEFDEPNDFYYISTYQDDLDFYFNNKDQLFSIVVYDLKTVKGLVTGDSASQICQLYGKEDEYDAQNDKYVYYKNDYMFSIDVNNSKIAGWSVFVNTWNEPDLRSSTNSQSKQFGGDDVIKFNENNFSKYFKFGMKKSSVEKLLTNYGVRITDESQYDTDRGGAVIYTDHVYLGFDYNNKLACISVEGWETAKGLNCGDTPDQLNLLYGKENSYDNSGSGNEYTFTMKGFLFVLQFDLYQKGLNYWTLYPR